MSDKYHDLSGACRINQYLKAFTFALIGLAILFITIAGAGSAPDYILIVFSWPPLAAAGRNIHALLAEPHLRLHHKGISLRYWDFNDLSLDLLRPTHRMIEQNIPWHRFLKCSVYGRRDLIIETAGFTHVIDGGIFSESSSHIQLEILDYIDVKFHQDAREAGRVRDFCKRRFSVPLLIEPGETLGTAWAAVFRQTKDQKYIELRAEGLALGPKPESMLLTPWDEIVFVRPTITTKVNHLTGSEEAPVLESIEVRLKDRASILLYSIYKRSLADIQNLLDPPPDKPTMAWRLMETGEDIEQAARSVGLAGREDA